MKRFGCHVDKKQVKGFKQEPNRTIIWFHKGDSVGREEDGLEKTNPKAGSYCESLEKVTGSKTKKKNNR